MTATKKNFRLSVTMKQLEFIEIYDFATIYMLIGANFS